MKIKAFILGLICLFLFSRGLPKSIDVEKDDAFQLKKAFDDGLVSLTFAAKKSGEKLEVTVKRLYKEPLLLKIESGKTKFEFGKKSVTIVTDKVIEIDLSKKEEGSFTVSQVGNTRITSGSITWQKQRKK